MQVDLNSSEIEKNIIQLEKDFLDENMVKVFAIVKDVSRRLKVLILK